MGNTFFSSIRAILLVAKEMHNYNTQRCITRNVLVARLTRINKEGARFDIFFKQYAIEGANPEDDREENPGEYYSNHGNGEKSGGKINERE